MTLQPLTLNMQEPFLAMTNSSRDFHEPWVSPPLTVSDFAIFYERYQQPNQKCFVLFSDDQIAGVFNISEIVRGFFQSAYLGFYAAKKLAGQGMMRHGLVLTLKEAFTTLDLHRLEANIQPNNMRSIELIKQGGFRKEGFSMRYLKINTVWCDHERWAMTIEDWQKAKENNHAKTESE